MVDLSNAIIVVEGATDVQYLSTFINSAFQITNGSSVPRETICYLKEASKTKDIIVLTDPDYPGERIRKIINENISNCLNAYVRKEYSIKGNKVGVAESTKEEILYALSKITLSKRSNIKGNLTNADLYKLGLTGYKDSFIKRKLVSEHFNLGFNNSKSLLKKLNEFNIKYKEIEEYLNGK